MSDSHGHASAHAHGSAHDHAHDFDPMPTDELAAGEPRTPEWLPILGACLFLVGGTWFLASSSDGASSALGHKHDHGEGDHSAPARTAAERPAAAARAPLPPRPIASADDAEARRKLIEAAVQKAKQSGVGAKVAPVVSAPRAPTNAPAPAAK
jgi:hypothetical protein